MCKCIYAFYFLLMLAVFSFSQAPAENIIAKAGGNLLDPTTQLQNSNSIADWWCTQTYNKGTDSTEKIVSTVYGSGYMLKQFYNNTDSTCHIAFKCTNSTGHIDTIAIPSYTATGKLPQVYSIITKATTGKWLFYFQYGIAP